MRIVKISHKDYTERLLEILLQKTMGIEIKKYWNNEKSLLLNHPYKNINIEIKPKNTGLFVVQLTDFEFFDYALLECYWRKVLHHEDAKFILNSKCIYIYPKKREDMELCLNVLNYTTETILNTISQIKNLIS